MTGVGLNTMPLLGKSQGVRRYVRELSTRLAAIEGVNVTSVGLPDEAHVPRSFSVRKAGFFVRQAQELALAPRRAAPGVDVLHYTDTYGPLMRGNAPVVVTVHDTTFLTHPELHDRWVTIWLSALSRATWSRAQAIISVSELTARDLEAVGVPREKVVVIPHGVDHADAREEGAPAGLTAGRYFAYAGNIEPRKDVPTLLSAFERVLDQLPEDVVLAITGRHAWGPALDVPQRVKDRIVFTGWLSDAQLCGFMAHSMAFVYPSKYEGFGLPPLEALHLGARVIVGDTPVARETLAQHAEFFTPGDVEALAELLVGALKPDTRDREQIRQHTAQFTWDRAARETLAVYRSVA
jgi:glycosyltransferase involved in cell wall biosynthesis